MAFQDNAWCDEKIMREWIHHQWIPACNGNMLLAIDVHKAQTTNAIKECLKKDCKTEPIFVSASTTSLVQPVNVVFNAPFKAAMEREAAEHLQENFNSYVEGRVNASEHGFLFTTAWAELSSNTDMIIQSFEKYGISVAPYGSEDQYHWVGRLQC